MSACQGQKFKNKVDKRVRKRVYEKKSVEDECLLWVWQGLLLSNVNSVTYEAA